MGSFAALHFEAAPEALLPHVDEWARAAGFAAAQPFSEPPRDLGAFYLNARCLGLGALNSRWSILHINGFSLPRRVSLSASAVEPLAERCACRSLLFIAQTTSDAYELAAFDAGQRIRHLNYADGDRMLDEGAPLPGESGNTFRPVAEWDDDSPSPMDDAIAICEALGFSLWQFPVLQGRGHIWRRRGLFSRWFGRG